MITIEFNKLVRNKLSKVLTDHQVIVSSTILTADQFIQKLKEKIVEEAKEVQAADINQELIIEIADLCEAIDTLIKICHIDKQDVENAKIKKKEEIGCFTKESYINNIEVVENNTEVIDYLRSKGKIK
ncbi:MAG: hypothetical protein EOP33_03930 [Rickettsiaceae bacterium]|nr:MAG: hypothetical protein EOP33_03930 [Rickettsiaceae bacterium]